MIQIGVPQSKDIYIHRIGRTGRAGKSGRGDLVLSKFEENILNTELKALNLKPLTFKDVEVDLEESINSLETSEPRAYPRLRQNMQTLTQRAAEPLINQVGEEVIRDTFLSKCGYFIGKADVIRTYREDILEAMKEWAVQAGGLPEPPYVSSALLKNLGIGKEGSGGGRRVMQNRSQNSFNNRNFNDRNQSQGRQRGYNDNQTRGRSYNDNQSRGRSFNDNYSGGRSFNDSYSGGRSFNDNNSGGRDYGGTVGLEIEETVELAPAILETLDLVLQQVKDTAALEAYLIS